MFLFERVLDQLSKGLTRDDELKLHPEKGWKFTLDNLPKIAQSIDVEKVAFLIVGDGELREKIAQVMADNVPHFLFSRPQLGGLSFVQQQQMVEIWQVMQQATIT